MTADHVKTPSTIPALREHGSTPRVEADLCGNCGAALLGPYCAQCGQQRRGLDMPVVTFLGSAFAGLASFDSRFWRTVMPLIGRPGFLTRELIEGRRVRYVPPMRLYLFVSFVFFLTVQLTGQEIVVNTSGPSGRGVVTINTGGAVEAERLDADGEPFPPLDAERSAPEPEPGGRGTPAAPPEPTDRTTAEPTETTLGTRRGEDGGEGLGELLTRSVIKLAEDPERATDVLLGRLPLMVFLLVPLAALWLRLLFRRRQSYYVPNLVASLHLHSAVLLLLNVSMLTEYLPGPDLLGALIVLWIPVYTLLTLRRVYQTGWWGSVWRLGVFGFVHMMALLLGLFASVVVTGMSL